MGAYDDIKVDTGLETKGVVIDYGNYRITLARAGGSNKNFQKALERLSAPFERAMTAGSMSNTQADNLMKEAYAEQVILNWEVPAAGKNKWKQGIEDPDTGNVVAFNKENVLKILNHPALHTLWSDLKSQAGKNALFLASLAEAKAGN